MVDIIKRDMTYEQTNRPLYPDKQGINTSHKVQLMFLVGGGDSISSKLIHIFYWPNGEQKFPKSKYGSQCEVANQKLRVRFL